MSSWNHMAVKLQPQQIKNNEENQFDKKEFAVLGPFFTFHIIDQKHINLNNFPDTPRKQNWFQTCPTCMCWLSDYILLHRMHPTIHRTLHKWPEKVTQYSLNMQSHHIQPYMDYRRFCVLITKNYQIPHALHSDQNPMIQLVKRTNHQ